MPLIRTALLAAAIPLLAACSSPDAPGLAGYLHILEAARDARMACSGLGIPCEADLARSLADAEAAAPRRLLLPPDEAETARRKAETAFQAAYTDCRARGILPGTRRWDSCRMDRSIERLNELAGLPE